MADIYSESTPSRSRRRWERLRDDEREITGRARMAWLDSRADYARIRTTRVRRRCDMIDAWTCNDRGKTRDATTKRVTHGIGFHPYLAEVCAHGTEASLEP